MRRPTNRRKVVPDKHGGWRLRLWWGKRRRHSSRLLVKCGDCDNRLEIVYDDQTLEIGGVIASIPEWRRVLQPLLDAGVGGDRRAATPGH